MKRVKMNKQEKWIRGKGGNTQDKRINTNRKEENRESPRKKRRIKRK